MDCQPAIYFFKKLVIWEVKVRIDVSFQYFVLVSLCLNFFIYVIRSLMSAGQPVRNSLSGRQFFNLLK